jgi:hypothetical protein
MSDIELQDVFTITGTPSYTFVKPKEYDNLLLDLKTDGLGIVIEGPSGIGKTTAVLKAIEEAHINQKALILSARKQSDIEIINNLSNLKPFNAVVLIDDFHRLSDEQKKYIADLMKVMADEGDTSSKIIIIGINKAGEALINFADDLTTRIHVISFEKNSDELVEELVSRGESVLNININIKDEIVKSANGSFYLAQMLARDTCAKAKIQKHEEDKKNIVVSFPSVKSDIFDNLALKFDARTKEFARGNRFNPEGRAPYLFLLCWLGTSNEWTLSLDDARIQHPKLKGSLIQIVEKNYLDDLLKKITGISDLLHYDHNSHLLTVEDPLYVFYLRNMDWKRFARDVGYLSLDSEFKSLYDFALSFSGSVRDIAERIFEELSSRDIAVFYDKNEKERLLGGDLKEYLKPIYQSDATFVVALLSKDYAERIWTSFEAANFKERFKTGSVIPIRFSDTPEGMFSNSKSISGLSFDINKDVATQITSICDDLEKKLTYSRQTLILQK